MNRMKKSLLVVATFLSLIGTAQQASTPILRTDKEAVAIFENDAKKVSTWWVINPAIRPDVYETSAEKVSFLSERDTLTFHIEKNKIYDFFILQNGRDTAYTRIKWVTGNPLEEPSAEFCKLAPSGLLSRKQAQFDIDALIYTFSEVHPNMFHECGQARFMEAVGRVKNNLPDSVSKVQLYKEVAPLIAMLGDGHSNLNFPFNDLFTEELHRFPLFVDINLDNYAITATTCIDSLVPRGAEVLSINGIESRALLENMMPYASGERYFFRLARVNFLFPALFEILYAADSYEVTYREPGKKKNRTVLLKPATWDEIKQRTPKSKKQQEKVADYSFTLDKEKNVAIMDFLHFNNPAKARAFADSMFRTIREQGITNLIIDIRNNGGGSSVVGDEFLRYISPVPFQQMSKAFVRITPTTRRLMNSSGSYPGLYYYNNDTKLIKPLTAEEGHFNGKVYLLTSHQTFSSAGSFAWAFKQFGMGTVIGEETGGMNVCFGDILFYKLPVSGLSCSISYKRFWQYGADEKDIHGTLPDYTVPEAAALDEALKRIKKK